MSKMWKVGFVFFGIFIAGAIVGGFASLRFAREFVQKRGASEQFAMMHKGRLNESLKLTAAQRARIDVIVDETGEELRKFRKETNRIFQVMNTRISVELTPEQKREFEEMQTRWRERRPQRPPSREEREAGKREDGKAPVPPGPGSLEKREP